MIEECLASLTKLRHTIEKSLEGIQPDKGGPTVTKYPLRMFIFSLKDIFERVTGTRATIVKTHEYGGRFHRFVSTCLKSIESIESTESIETTWGNDAVGYQIEQVLKQAPAE